MKILSGNLDFFALDIGTTAVRAVQLTRSGDGWILAHYGVAPVDIRVGSSDAADDQRKLGEIIMTVLGQSGIKTKSVVLGVPSNKMFATVVDLPDMPESELASTIKYQADQYIPMALDEAKIDWAVLGKPTANATNNEVLLASVANTFIESRLDLVEGLGLDVVAIEPDSLALVRSLQPTGAPEGRIIIELGDFTTDIIITYNDSPRLIRSVPTGVQTFVKAASQNLNVQPAQAQQFILKFGLQKDKLEGQVFRSLESTMEQFVAEIVKSVKFFQTRYPNIPLSSMTVSNYAVTIPGFSKYLSDKISIPVEGGNPWQKVKVSAADQVALQPLSSQFGVAIGLAQRGIE